MTVAAVIPSAGTSRLRPLDASRVSVDRGFWGERLSVNRAHTIPHGLEQLETSGALDNFRHAARGSGRYVGGLDDAGLTFPFIDSDVYKWLEAAGWEQGRAADAALAERAGSVISLVGSAQRDDGYLNTFVQLSGREPYLDLQWGHELYCIGHLLQAAVAWQRSLGDERLLAVATRAVDHIDAAMGEGRREGIGGHPEIEMALVEAYRATGRERFLGLARTFVERRGRGLLGAGRLGRRYWQDHEPVRTAPTMAGHAVRQMYLECGVVDVATETGDAELLDAVLTRWEDMWSRRTYLTGALGSRHRDEAFGDPFELPPDRAYAETCAAIGSVMLAWRLLLATGEPRFGDAIERTLYNAVLPGLSLDGTAFFYTNPLHVREGSVATGTSALERQQWYPCACCPPNLMRTLSSFEHLIATASADGVQVQQLASATIETEWGGSPLRLQVETSLPWEGRVSVEVVESPAEPWALELRLPSWLRSGALRVAGEVATLDLSAGRVSAHRPWSAGDRLELEMDLPVRAVVADEHIDAVRGCVALERGPLVYCVEEMDVPDGVGPDDIRIDADAECVAVSAEDLPGVAMAIEAPGRLPEHSVAADHPWPYVEASTRGTTELPRRPATIRAIPYLAWANRRPGPMRVWLPTSGSGATESARAED
jgi:uncharacterized protein